MPIVGLFTGGANFSDRFTVLGGDGTSYATIEAAQEAGANLLKHGSFIQAIIDFLIIAGVIFMLVRWMNNLKKKEEEAPAAPAEPPEDVVLLREIRDSLTKGS